MLKNIVKAIYDIAKANGVTVDVAADMLKHNAVMKENINKGSDFDFSNGVEAEELNTALDFAGKHYAELVEAYANGTFDELFSKEEA